MARPASAVSDAGAPPDGIAARASRLVKMYGSGDTAVTALRGIDIDFPAGRFTAIMGPSGSGKSTLMHCLAGLDTVTEGGVYIGSVDLSRLSDKHLTQLRRDRIGFVFQQFNLLPTLTAGENITLPLDIAGRRPDREWMDIVVAAVGLGDRLKHRPTELSGGQQQRVACARALVTRPDIVFADEPTGNLDSRSGAEVLSFLRSSVREMGQTIVMVTHDPTAASYADDVVFLADGRIVDWLERPTADRVLERMKHLDNQAAASGTAKVQSFPSPPPGFPLPPSDVRAGHPPERRAAPSGERRSGGPPDGRSGPPPARRTPPPPDGRSGPRPAESRDRSRGYPPESRPSGGRQERRDVGAVTMPQSRGGARQPRPSDPRGAGRRPPPLPAGPPPSSPPPVNPPPVRPPPVRPPDRARRPPPPPSPSRHQYGDGRGHDDGFR
jgi:ABC-type lipoprotein export system ATPase subunit